MDDKYMNIESVKFDRLKWYTDDLEYLVNNLSEAVKSKKFRDVNMALSELQNATAFVDDKFNEIFKEEVNS